MSHITWAKDWKESYPMPPVASNDFARSELAFQYKTAIGESLREVFFLKIYYYFILLCIFIFI